MLVLSVNGERREVDVAGEHPLLWALRERLRLTGTKFGCGIGACGACTVLVDGKPERSCQLRVDQVLDAQITTIEGLPSGGGHPVQQA